MIWILIIGLMVLSWIVSATLKRKLNKYFEIGMQSGMSGAEVAHQMLRDHRIYDVEITCTPGSLTDHYNPATKTVNLSEPVYYGRTAASAAIAAHECGHAVQHATAYSFLEFRSMMVPVQNVSSRILNFIFLLSFGSAIFFQASILPPQTALLLIIACYAVITLFSVITLPVEFDASKRALAWVQQNRVVTEEEYGISKDALNWAAMTYVVAAISSLSMLFYYVLQYLSLGDD